MAQAERTAVAGSATPFKVVRHYVEMVPRHRTEVLIETADPIEANVVRSDWMLRHQKEDVPRIVGDHSTHQWVEDRCTVCDSPRNGCFKSQLPCGFEYEGAFRDLMDAWRAERAEQTDSEGAVPTSRPGLNTNSPDPDGSTVGGPLGEGRRAGDDRG